MKIDTHVIRQYLLNLQQTICSELTALDQRAQFNHDAWQRENHGDGLTRIMEQGAVFEQAAVNFSHVFGNALPKAATIKRPDLVDSTFEALGVSIVIHPQNPYVPTTHANIRFFLAYDKNNQPIWWFGGGFDLTPFYPFLDDCEHWHRIAKTACDPFGKDVYATFKKQCDDYFYLKHRGETRGIGGLFFDDINFGDFETSFRFMQSVGDHFLKAYLPIVEKRKDTQYTQRERDFQCYRRGRYVEFNLLYDRGTLFGLQFGGRTESILASLPPEVKFRYNWKPDAGTPEAEIYDYLKARDYI